MKNNFLIIYVFLLQTFCSQLTAQIKYTVNDAWQFVQDKSITEINQLKNHKGVKVAIPHTWNDKDVMDEEEGFYRGAGWYTKTIKIPTAYKDKEVFLFFEGVAMVSEVYINNKLANKHVGGFTRFVVPVSKFIDFDTSKNSTSFTVVVKADNSYDDDVPPLHADFTFFGGIYRDVNLVVTDKVHFSIEEDAANGVFVTTPKVSAQKGEVQLKVKIKNDDKANQNVKLVTKLIGPNQQLVSEKVQTLKLKSGIANEFNFALNSVTNPELWSPDTPNLYKVVCEIFDAKNNQKIDESTNSLGFRWFAFDVDKGFFLNGKHLKLVGTNRHQDFKDIGNAVPDHIHVEDILRMKEMGSNFLRIAHYPQDPIILEMCDRLGILTTVETPIVDTVTESEAFTQNCLSAQLEMIRQNYNHPSLIIWAYMNEVILHPRYGNDKERYKKYTNYIVELAQKIEKLTRAEDPYRYTMIPNHNGLERYHEAGLTEVPMIVGWNIYLGWYGGSYDLLPERIEKFHSTIKKTMIITEYGAGVDPRLHTLNPMRFDYSQEYGTEFHKYYLEYFMKQDFVAGVNVWNYADFNSEDRIDAVQSINNKGLVGLDRKPKDVFYYYQASLLSKPFLAIATKTWNQRSQVEDKEGAGVATMQVQVFSNQNEVTLFINGKSLGAKKVEDKIAIFNVPFVDGINQLVAKSGDIVEDFSTIRVNIIPISLKNFPATGFSINVGDQRFFYDDKIDQAWLFDKEYTPGSWGHIGGKPYVRPEKNVQQPYGAKQTIKGTFNDPIYQTQLVGIEQYRFDVPPGLYEIKLHFAELEGSKAKHLAFDLIEESKEVTKVTNRKFSILINDKKVIANLDLLGDYGEYQAVKIKSEVSVKEGEPLLVNFKKIVGEPVLNAIEIYKKM
ncbi:glycoside hydrolase family 2 TIM barrel-domain containing protein [Flavobacterium sp. NG2]|uniref:glycoside hydrolase family 2 TIM barrel-domain containing protein n=1 Tax=Flavobacterium sp. NG2 TaxID=3097547 RepID=UPI002A81586F|nr:glycoside hydrolase family 2 TIM barrel-domain containing protein [Flavobacterium sp. NG2]WPR70152.1 glycoside hydrolase family 2 TIM barrel-domain containing protein [Flavobacterium sp. NG2]